MNHDKGVMRLDGDVPMPLMTLTATRTRHRSDRRSSPWSKGVRPETRQLTMIMAADMAMAPFRPKRLLTGGASQQPRQAAENHGTALRPPSAQDSSLGMTEDSGPVESVVVPDMVLDILAAPRSSGNSEDELSEACTRPCRKAARHIATVTRRTLRSENNLSRSFLRASFSFSDSVTGSRRFTYSSSPRATLS